MKLSSFFSKLKSNKVESVTASVAQLRQDPSIRTTLYLLLGVVGLGTISGVVGYFFGHESLKGVTQPDMNPFTAASAQGQYPREGSFLLKESEILAKVERETKGISKASEPKKSPAAKPEASKDSDKAKENADSKTADQPQSAPVSVKSEGVQLQVRSAKVEDNAIVLEVAIRNDGAKPVQFLYDFLDIADDQTQFLSSEVTGLPTQLPAKSETFTGVIKVSGGSPSTMKWISLALADYPNQKVELKVPKLAVKP